MLNSGAVGGSPMPHQRKPPVNSGNAEWWAPLKCARCGTVKQAGEFPWVGRSNRTRRMRMCRDCYGAAISAGRQLQIAESKPKPHSGNHTKEHMDRMRQLSIDARRAKKSAKLAAPSFTEPKPRMWTGILRWVRGLFA